MTIQKRCQLNYTLYCTGPGLPCTVQGLVYLVLYRAWFTLYCTGPGLPGIALECATQNPGFDMHCCIGAAKDV